MTKKAKPIAGAPWHKVRKSKLHGTGVFAKRNIPAGTRIFEYEGKRISAEQADEMFPVNPDDPFHTFFFALSSGRIIDGGQGGNDSRWINHSCEPNCETQEGRHGKRVFVHALRDIAKGEELVYDYGLIIDEEMSETLKQQYRCLCGSAQCRGTMLALTAEGEVEDEASAEEDSTVETELNE
ncbi:MAG: SET domain-containing protein-lysine N-methyltransferase [Pelistega sp.]|nr:SET domain-containing protein-lysine N-methyltransferase [Pelistega sp.]